MELVVVQYKLSPTEIAHLRGVLGEMCGHFDCGSFECEHCPIHVVNEKIREVIQNGGGQL